MALPWSCSPLKVTVRGAVSKMSASSLSIDLSFYLSFSHHTRTQRHEYHRLKNSVFLFFLSLPSLPSIYLSVCLSIYPSICLSVCRSIYLSIHLSVSVLVSLFFCPPFCPSLHLSTDLSIHQSINLFASFLTSVARTPLWCHRRPDVIFLNPDRR